MPPPPPVPVCANVSWESDDKVHLDGKPAVGAFVKFGTNVPVLNNSGWEENPNLLQPNLMVWTRQNSAGNWEEVVRPRINVTVPDPVAVGGRTGVVAAFNLLATRLETDAEYAARMTSLGFTLRTRRNTIAGWRQIVVASNAGTGAPEVMTNEQGEACTWFRQGTVVGMTAYINAPIPSTARAGAGSGNVETVTAGSGSARLTVSKYSPEITLNMTMTDDQDIDSKLTMRCSLDGNAIAPITIDADNAQGWGSKNLTYKFFQILPDDNEHVFKVEDITSENGLMGADPRPATMADLKAPKTIQRNGVYGMQVNVASIAPK